jgi:hypothetical protein
VLFLLQGAWNVRYAAPTYDEAMTLTAGYSYLVRRDFRLHRESPPLVKTIIALPLFMAHRLPFTPPPEQWRVADGFRIGQHFLYASAVPADRLLALSRSANLGLGALLVALVGWWSHRLWGPTAALVAIALAALEPNLVAHASVATTDVGCTLFIVSTLYLLWECLASPSAARWLAAGIATGLALASKYAAITLFPIIGIVLAGHVLLEPGPRPLRARLRHAAGGAALVCLSAMSVVWAAYFFQGFAPWWTGLRRFLALAAAGQASFFLGQYSYEGWWSYFPVAFLVKTPVGTLCLIAASLILARAGAPLRRREALVLLTPVVVVLGVAMHARTHIGVRHILAVYPFLFVLASRLVTIRPRPAWLTAALVALALAATALSTLRVAPHQLAYFNELVGGPEEGHRYLSDSNLDWGQDLKAVKTFMEQAELPIIYLSYFGTAPPAYYGIRHQYVPGSWPLEWPLPPDLVPADLERKMLAISLFNLQEVQTHDAQLFAWLRARRPVARIGYSIRLYDLTGDPDALLELGEVYRKTGLAALARAEARKVLTLDPANTAALALLDRVRGTDAPASAR